MLYEKAGNEAPDKYNYI
jgi:hypothetical protein